MGVKTSLPLTAVRGLNVLGKCQAHRGRSLHCSRYYIHCCIWSSGPLHASHAGRSRCGSGPGRACGAMARSRASLVPALGDSQPWGREEVMATIHLVVPKLRQRDLKPPTATGQSSAPIPPPPTRGVTFSVPRFLPCMRTDFARGPARDAGPVGIRRLAWLPASVRPA